MNDLETTRLSRLVMLLTLLQTKRVVTASELADRFSVSTRTIYRDIRTLEAAGVPVVTLEGKGYSLMEGYRIPPVMFTREQATALLIAEKLAANLTDPPTAELILAAMDKLRAALRYADRDHLEKVSGQIEVMELVMPPDQPNSYQQLVAAVTSRRVAQINYQAAETGELTSREIEPIGLYLSQQWHVIAYCRLRQAFRDFRLDRIASLTISEENFLPRSQTLQQYWDQQVKRNGKQKVVIRFDPSQLPAAQVRHFQDTKHRYGWTHEQILPDATLEVLFLVGSLPYLAAWLLPFAAAVTVLEPAALSAHLSDLAMQVYRRFCVSGP
ncbi:helix-turn-helix transcriptional regulator [Dyadobacter jiangsuensis]|uniref:Putative DNA-binding transcriptional regulator YafY n=1 Tax=Dyadobacter jiangsuensis TaxID=1591085 RepID=A0A2P8GCE6_9BACT|nr:YafY family protein [Dyadobacter jiangsuensis]PSL31617.1 putative DNA-binding transcriptional regulator YafY [Dyadobacter jiangsuensis]